MCGSFPRWDAVSRFLTVLVNLCRDLFRCWRMPVCRVGFIPGHSSFVGPLNIGGELTERYSGVSYDVSLSISRIIRENPVRLRLLKSGNSLGPSLPNQRSGLVARSETRRTASPQRGAFFASAFWWPCAGRPCGAPGSWFLRSTNLRTAATHSFSSDK